MDTISTNKIPLDSALVEQFKSYQKNIRSNTVDMALKAFEIRSQYLSADGLKYSADFEKWWALNRLNTIFGNRATFTKWAKSGESLEQAKFDKYSDRMPHTLTALYEVSQLTPDELKLCLQGRYSRASLTDEPKGSKKPTPLIHPEVSASAIKSWRTKWRNPPVKSTEKRRLSYAVIKVHGSLFDFDKKAAPKGFLSIEKLKEINDVLIHAMQPFNDYVLLETKLDSLVEGHQKRQQQAEDHIVKIAERAAERDAKRAARDAERTAEIAARDAKHATKMVERAAERGENKRKEIFQENEDVRHIGEWLMLKGVSRSDTNAAAKFVLARRRLYDSEPMRREKYFGIASHFVPPEGYTGQPEVYPPKKEAVEGTVYSKSYKDYVRKGWLDPDKGGTVIPVADPSCDEGDAARYIAGFKKKLITIP